MVMATGRHPCQRLSAQASHSQDQAPPTPRRPSTQCACNAQCAMRSTRAERAQAPVPASSRPSGSVRGRLPMWRVARLEGKTPRSACGSHAPHQPSCRVVHRTCGRARSLRVHRRAARPILSTRRRQRASALDGCPGAARLRPLVHRLAFPRRHPGRRQRAGRRAGHVHMPPCASSCSACMHAPLRTPFSTVGSPLPDPGPGGVHTSRQSAPGRGRGICRWRSRHVGRAWGRQNFAHLDP